jgi:hypothetical protein
MRQRQWQRRLYSTAPRSIASQKLSNQDIGCTVGDRGGTETTLSGVIAVANNRGVRRWLEGGSGWTYCISPYQYKTRSVFNGFPVTCWRRDEAGDLGAAAGHWRCRAAGGGCGGSASELLDVLLVRDNQVVTGGGACRTGVGERSSWRAVRTLQSYVSRLRAVVGAPGAGLRMSNVALSAPYTKCIRRTSPGLQIHELISKVLPH